MGSALGAFHAFLIQSNNIDLHENRWHDAIHRFTFLLRLASRTSSLFIVAGERLRKSGDRARSEGLR